MLFNTRIPSPFSFFGGAKPMSAFLSNSKLLASTALAIALSGCVADPVPSGSSSSENSSSVQAVSSVASSSVAVSSIAVSSEASSTPSSSVASSSSLAINSSSMPSSSLDSSSSVASSTASNTPDLAAGKNFYDSESLGCAKCHGADGKGEGPQQSPIPTDSLKHDGTLEGLTQYLEAAMPFGAPGNCVGDCARDAAAYILSGYGNEGSTIADQVDDSVRAVRVEKGRLAYTSASLTCNICHGAEAEIFVQCENCDTWLGLRQYINDEMPPTSGELNPSLCSIENECADQAADYIWNTVNQWALTNKNGIDGGVKVTTENRTGQDTRRLKTYDMFTTDFDRIFGSVPSVLAGSRGAFKPAPEFWHTEGELGASALNVLVNAALQGCEDEANLPAINDASLKNACADWANRMWLRPATATELQACADVALIDADELNNAKTQAVYACVSMMVALPAITF